jgi:peptidyl-prolyl cis-trans isomerase A (cyclophilin A)
MLYLCCLAALGALGALAFAAGPAAADDKDKPVVVLETDAGNITLELDRSKAPKTVDNFLKYVDDGYYDGTIFHRVMDGFMIQGGGMTKDGQPKKTRDPVKNESGNGLSNTRGTIAMARTSNPDSATAQFFINLTDKNTFLDTLGGGYTVFGKVTEGMDVVDKIAKGQTVANPQGEKSQPVQPVVVKSAKRKGKS